MQHMVQWACTWLRNNGLMLQPTSPVPRLPLPQVVPFPQFELQVSCSCL